MQGPNPVLSRVIAWCPKSAYAISPPKALSSNYVASLRAFRTVFYVEANSLTFCEGFETAALDSAEVYKYVCTAIVLRNETEAFRLVEPLYCTCSHDIFTFKNK
jgi:hypothetical protein